MNTDALQTIRESITNWMGERRLTFENKKVHPMKNPAYEGEYVVFFTNSVSSFFKDGKLIEISLRSKPFITGTLSDNSLSKNPKGDGIRLKEFLEEFDNDFYQEAEKKLEDSNQTSDPLFF